jgi:aerobic-type carbon monoxide dehydrogenase small subunit (CoxS/CutS family)
MKLMINGRGYEVKSDSNTPLLWVLRDELGLTGAKIGCAVGLCGACTVHVEGQAARACQTAVGDLGRKRVTTIEGLGGASGPHPVQAAWIKEQVPQCGYCQSGMIMAVAAMLAKTPRPTDAEIDSTITNLCRCGTYVRIRRAIHRAAGAA